LADYTETLTTFTLTVAATLNDQITVVSMRTVSSGIYFDQLNILVYSTLTNTVTWGTSTMPYQLINVGDIHTFLNTGTPTQYTVTGVNYTTRIITYSATVTGVSAGASIYKYRALGSSYPVFSRWNMALSSSSSYTPTDWNVHSGYELLFMNGDIINEQDYDIVSGAITNFPSVATGNLTMIQFGQNNLTTPIGTPVNVVTFTINGQSLYSFTYDANAFNLYANGVLQIKPSDYTTATGNYTFTSTPTNSTTVLVQQTFSRTGAA
jgi:hypothetical protein